MASKNDDCPYIYIFILIGLETSMRRSEILSIEWRHIDIQRHMIFLPKAKAGARHQPITKRLANALDKYLKGAECTNLNKIE